MKEVKDQPITLTLQLSEVSSIMQVLGELPTKSGAYPLVVKIQEQTNLQLQMQQEPENADA